MRYNQIKLWYLRNLNIFENLPPKEILHLHEATTFKKFNKKEFIYLPEYNLQNVYIIKEGCIVIGYLNENGRTCATNILTNGELFGAVMGEEISPGYARAVERTIICIIDRNEFENILEKYPRLSLRVVKMLGNKINILENKIQNLVFKDVKSRLFDLLRSLYLISGEKESGIINISLSHQDMANLVGCTRETITINLKEMKKKGIIDYNRKNIKIIRLNTLLQKNSMNTYKEI